jgi:hypothetical protein
VNLFPRRAFLCILLVVLFSLSAAAQISDKVVRVETAPYQAGAPLGIRVELLNASLIDRIDVAYRSFGETDYKHLEMQMQGNSAQTVIPAKDLTPPFLEYYLALYLHNGATETYPVENPTEHPLKIDLQSSISAQDDAIIILSPEPNETFRSREDALISFSLIHADSSIDKSTVKIYIDGADVTSKAIFTGDIVTIPPPEYLEGGKHSIRIQVSDRDGSSAHVTAMDFGLKTTEGPAGSSSLAPKWTYRSHLQAETRNENIANSVTPYNRLSLSASGEYDWLRLDGSLFVTNEENDRRQPQNRFLVSGESRWLRLGYGDHYPVFQDLIMTGKRVRGFFANLTLGFFNLDVSKGDITRRIESDTLRTFLFDSLASEQASDSTGAFGPYDQTRWAKFNRGTFSRDLLVVRPSFGSREGAHFGLTYLKSKDDITSIIYGGKPKENLVLGSDFLIPLFNHGIEITGQSAFSATNNDITGGTFTDTRIDSIYSDYSESARNTIRKVRDVFQNFITINENLIPLNLKNAPTLAYEAGLAVNYFNNYFKFTYLRHGNNFESFGQSFVRTDVVGFNIADRLRLLNNQVLLTGGFERLQDNTAETKPATTTGTTTNVSISWYPKKELPSVTVGYLFASNANDHPDTLWRIEDRLDRILVQLGKDFTFGGHHTAVLSVSTSTRDDQSFRNLDGKNTMVSLSNSTSFEIPLQTLVSLTVSSNTFATSGASSISTDYTTLYAMANYRFLGNKLIVGASVSPTFGDIERTLFDARSEYYFVPNLSLAGQLSVYLNKQTTNDVIWSFILRADL